jgi:hypothetical protein
LTITFMRFCMIELLYSKTNIACPYDESNRPRIESYLIAFVVRHLGLPHSE